MNECVPLEVVVSHRNRIARAIVVAIVATLAVFALAACTSSSDEPDEETTSTEQESVPEEAAPEVEDTATASAQAEEVTELVIEDVVVGEGAEATAGSTVLVHYTGYLVDGTVFDS